MIFLSILLLLLLVGLLVYVLGRPSGARPVERLVEVNGMTRRYRVWLPPRHRNQPARLPVVLAFHPGFGSPEGFEQQIMLHHAAAGYDFLVVYPEGYQRSWNAGTCCGPALRDKIDDVKFVRTILDDLATVAPVDRRRVYVTGLSNGARLCYYLACRMSQEIAAIAPVAGTVQGPEAGQAPARPIPILHIHGLEDRWVPYRGGASVWKNAGIGEPIERGLEYWKRLAGVSAESRETMLGGAGDCLVYAGKNGVQVRLCRIAGLGHHWPGARLVGRYKEVAPMFGPLGPPIDLDELNGEILHFFAANALPPAGPQAREVRPTVSQTAT